MTRKIPRLRLYSFAFLVCNIIMINGCKKEKTEPSLAGTWTEIDNTTSQAPLGCELRIDVGSGDVSLCDIKFVHPSNVITASTRKKAKLFIENGQMYYKQRTADVLWVVPVAKENHYFLDYDLDGQFLWIVGNDTDAKVTAKGTGRVFKKVVN